MFTKFELPDQKEIEIEYDASVYSPEYSSIDTIVLANQFLKPGFSVIDVGCGSGKIACSLALLHPHSFVFAQDPSEAARKMTQRNADRLELEVSILEQFSGRYSMVVANLPTFDRKDMNTHPLHGPKEAYFADNRDGLKLYRKLFKDCRIAVKAGGFLIIECQEKLQSDLRELSEKEGFLIVTRTPYSFAFVNPLR